MTAKCAPYLPGDAKMCAIDFNGRLTPAGDIAIILTELAARVPILSAACRQGGWSESCRSGGEIARAHGGIKARETSIAGLASMDLANPRSL
jgi:hypothetical protein